MTRAQLWTGCADCPFDVGGCPMRSNAEQLRRPDVRDQLRTLFRLGAGEAVPTLREVLAILSWAIVGRESCSHVKERNRDLGQAAFTATDGYFTRVVGGGMSERRCRAFAAAGWPASVWSRRRQRPAGRWLAARHQRRSRVRSGSSPVTPTSRATEAPGVRSGRQPFAAGPRPDQAA